VSAGLPAAAGAPRGACLRAALALVALTLALYPKAVFLGQAFYERDVHLVWRPQVEAFVRAVLSGSWPVWNPYLSFGHPMLANPHTQILYPFTWLNLILPPSAFYTVFVVAHTAFAGFGLFLLARRLGLSACAAGVAAACWIASGPFLSLGNMWIQLAGASWVPWVLLATEHALAARCPTPALLWGGSVALQLFAGSPDMSLMTLAAVGARTLWSFRPRAGRPGLDLRSLAVVAGAGAFALLLSAGLWLPALDLTRHTARWTLDSAHRTVWSVHPLGLAEIFSPVPLTDLPVDARVRGTLYDGGAPLVRSLYLGIPALALVAAAAFGAAATARRVGVLVLVGAAVFALGRHTPLYEIAVALAPALRVLRYPSKAMVLVSLGWALLAGVGFERWRGSAPIPRGRWWAAVLGPVLALGAAAGAVALLLGWRPDVFAAFLLPEAAISTDWRAVLAPAARRFAITAALSATVGVVGLMRMRRPRRAGSLAGVAAALIVLDLAVAGATVNPTVPAEFYRLRPPILGALHQDDLSRLFVYRYPFFAAAPDPGSAEDPYRIARYPPGLSIDAARTLGARLYMVPPAGGCWGVFGSYEPDLIGLYPAPLADLTRWMLAAERTPLDVLRFLRLGAVRFVSSLHVRGFDELSAVAVYPGILARPILLLEVPGALPRTYVVGTAQAADGDRAREILLDPRFDPSREVVLQDTALEAGPLFSGRSRIIDFRPDRVRVEAELSEPGVVVLVDAYDPGWKVTVDGRPASLLRANVAFRGVRVPAGRHVVEQVYRPWTVLYGLGASAAATLVGLAVVRQRAARALARSR
jgi:hypothetical protein